MADRVFDGADRRRVPVYFLGDRTHGIGEAGPNIADRHGLVALQQYVIGDRYDLRTVLDAEAPVVDHDGIA